MREGGRQADGLTDRLASSGRDEGERGTGRGADWQAGRQAAIAQGLHRLHRAEIEC